METTNKEQTETSTQQPLYPLNASYIIGVEGIDGCGKDTVCKLLVEAFAEHGVEATVVSPFVDTAVGKAVKELFAGDGAEKPLPTTEVMLIQAARYEAAARFIEPQLEAGKVIIMNRTADSTLTYNCMTKGGDLTVNDLMNVISSGVAGRYKPAVTFMVKAKLETCYERVQARGNPDVHEAKPVEWFGVVATAYNYLSSVQTHQYIDVINDGTLDELKATVDNLVRSHLMRVLVAKNYVSQDHITLQQERFNAAADRDLAKLAAAAEDIKAATEETDGKTV